MTDRRTAPFWAEVMADFRRDELRDLHGPQQPPYRVDPEAGAPEKWQIDAQQAADAYEPTLPIGIKAP